MTTTDTIAFQYTLSRVRILVDVDCLPDISEEIFEIVLHRKLAQVWEPSTTYSAGQVIQPTTRNGHWYKCIRAGTSDTIEPVWSTRTYSRYTETDTVMWEECGSDWNGKLYDLRGACHDAWSLKASKASHLVTQSAGNARIEAGALHENCRARAKEFASLVDSVRS